LFGVNLRKESKQQTLANKRRVINDKIGSAVQSIIEALFLIEIEETEDKKKFIKLKQGARQLSK